MGSKLGSEAQDLVVCSTMCAFILHSLFFNFFFFFYGHGAYRAQGLGIWIWGFGFIGYPWGLACLGSRVSVRRMKDSKSKNCHLENFPQKGAECLA